MGDLDTGRRSLSEAIAAPPDLRDRALGEDWLAGHHDWLRDQAGAD